MTLVELRTGLRINIFDYDRDFLTDGGCNYIINQAAKHIANWADAADQSLFVTSATATVATGTSGFSTCGFTAAAPGGFAMTDAAPFRRLLTATRTNHPTSDGGLYPLRQVGVEDKLGYIVAAKTETPCVYVTGNSLGVISPVDNVAISIDYVFALPEMTQDTDTPGQRGGSGTANALGIEYHGLIVTYATMIALRGENSDATAFDSLFQAQQQELQTSLAMRRGSRTGGA